MDPSVYIPAYLERAYVASHPELTDAARDLVHNDVSVNPHKYAQTEHAQALLSYAGVHRHLLDELHRIEDMGSDEEFEQTRNRLFDDMRDELLKIVRVDAGYGAGLVTAYHADVVDFFLFHIGMPPKYSDQVRARTISSF